MILQTWRRAVRAVTRLGAVALLLGCWEAPEAPNPDAAPLVVRSILTTLTDSQRVQIARAAPIAAGRPTTTTPVSDASVVVRGPDGEHVFRPEGPGRYAAVFRVQSGQRYTLAVQLPDEGGSVTGATTVPTPPDLSPMKPEIVVPGREGIVRLVWHPSRSAVAYGLSLRNSSAEPGGLTPFGGYTTDTVATMHAVSLCSDPCCPVGAALVLSLDAAYLGYFGVFPDTTRTPPTGRLDGATGVFTSVAGDSVPVRYDGVRAC